MSPGHVQNTHNGRSIAREMKLVCKRWYFPVRAQINEKKCALDICLFVYVCAYGR